MGKNDNLTTAILTLFIIGIFGVTVYFCLDIFNIVDIPEEYSITKFLGSKTTEISNVQIIEQIVDEYNIDSWINQESEETSNEITENIIVPDLAQTTYEIEEPNVETNQKSSVVNRMYYSQLDVYGRMIYDELNDHREELKTGTYVADFDTTFNDLLHEDNGAEILENAFQLSVNALLFDNPEIFYIDVTKMYMSTEVTSFGPLKRYRVKIGPLEGQNYLLDQFQDVAMVEQAIQNMENAREEIKIALYGDLYTQIKTVHDYIITHAQYDQSLSYANIYTAYGAMVEGKAVCEGYSKALKYVLDELEIPCVIVCGTARNSNGKIESHAWNYVKIEDNWYAIDSTWDDPVIVGEGYVSQDVYKRYFMKGSREFCEDHFEDGKIVEGSNFVYPTISEENYR